jgi:pimeloyl-ACP methyl ester carboxylesterase
MKNNYFVIAILISFVKIGFSQTQTFYVKPIQTDINYSAIEDSNYVVRNITTNLNKLVLFIGGSYSSPKDYSLFCQYPASIGFDVISLKYPNNVAAFSAGTSSDSLVFNKYRQELCFGTPTTTLLAVDTLNSIYTRTLKLIQYLAFTYPSQNWGQYLATPTTLDWSKIIVSGHSQGSGHACYLAKYFPVERLLMFSGPNDYSTYYNRPANWLRQSGITPIIKYFNFLHIQDEIVPFNYQFSNIKALGMLQADDTTIVDGLSIPFSNSHCLYTNIPAVSYHNSTIGAYPALPMVWNYMLTANVVSGVKELSENNTPLFIYPNPTNSNFTIEIPINITSKNILLYDVFGQLLLSKKTDSFSTTDIDLFSYPNGLYFIVVGNQTTKIIKN